MFLYFDVKNGILEPEFNNDIYSYHVSIEEDVESLDLEFEIDSKTSINVIGNSDLKIGDNYIFIELSKDNKVNTYSFLVNKEQTKTVFSYDEPIQLEIKSQKKEELNYGPFVIAGCFLLLIILFKLIFYSNKKQLNR